MEYFLGVDIGTTSAKAIAFSKLGKTLFAESVSYNILHPKLDRSEQDPDEIANAVVLSVENILHKLSPHTPVLCSFSAAMHSVMAVNETGVPISSLIVWADNRSARIAASLHEENKAIGFYKRTGTPVHPMSPVCKLLWLKENQRQLFRDAYKFIGIKEFIFFKLFGVFAVDESIAAATGLMNIQTQHWDPWILEQVGLETGQLSEIVSSEKAFYSPSLFPSLKSVPFVIGGSDGAMANIGTSDESDALVITVGTSSAARLITSNPQLDPGMRTFCYYLKEKNYLVGGAGNNGGIVMQWLQEDFFQAKDDVEEFLNQALTVPPGSDGLIFLPYLLGERAPIWNSEAKGVLFGLTINHRQANMIRASMEAVMYCLYDICQPLFEQTAIKKIYASGGFARSEIWLQILSDVFNLPVVVGETIENSCWGAVKWGMMSLAIPVSKNTVIYKTFYPVNDHAAVYQAGFKKFQGLYQLLKKEF